MAKSNRIILTLFFMGLFVGLLTNCATDALLQLGKYQEEQSLQNTLEQPIMMGNNPLEFQRISFKDFTQKRAIWAYPVIIVGIPFTIVLDIFWISIQTIGNREKKNPETEIYFVPVPNKYVPLPQKLF